jgi:arginine utilization regulatory protein
LKTKEYRAITLEVFRLMDEGIHVLDAEGKTVIYNEAMAHMEKMNRRDVLRKPFREVFGSIDEKDSTLLQALEKGKITTSVQQTYRNKNNNEITTVNSSYPIMQDGAIIGALEIAKNVTDIQKMSHTILDLHKATIEPAGVREHKLKKYNFDNIIGQNPSFVEIVERAKKAARSDASVFIYGETGTGKELIAQSIHFGGDRQDRPFLAQNCAALPESLLEGILFGTAKGGFTGAVDRAGLFEQADGGTLLLDEISAMPYDLQGKLLRVLQEDYVRPIGGSKDIPIDVRIIATINEPADRLIERGKLRKDLYYRLNIISINLPPLRERRDDILLLGEKFLDKHNRRSGKEVWMLSDAAKAKLLDYGYPGNVRELENIIMEGVSMIDSEHVLTEDQLSIIKPSADMPIGLERTKELGLSGYLESVEALLIEEALSLCDGNISHAAELLKIKRQTLQHKLKKR